MVSSCIASNRQQYHEYKWEYKWEYKREYKKEYKQEYKQETLISTNLNGRELQLRRSPVPQPQRIEALDLVRGLDAWSRGGLKREAEPGPRRWVIGL